MQKHHSKVISILIVPDDNSEPYSFRVRTSVVRALYVLAALLIIHIIAGAIFYWKYAALTETHEQLLATNAKLMEDNKRVVALYDEFNALEKAYEKVRMLLGVEDDYALASNKEPKQRKLFDNIRPAAKIERAPIDKLQKGESYFVTPQQISMHDYAENLPTLLPVKGFITMNYQKGGWFLPKGHNGIDIVAKKGTVIRAAGAGTIVFANWTYDLGNLLIIDHGGGILSYYGHNQRLLKYEKRYVQKGEPIALLGTSGRSSGPHLHFEIRKNGVPVDPKGYVLAFNENIMTSATN